MKAKTKAPPRADVEISPVIKPDKTWSFFLNDERSTYDQWIESLKQHKEWCADMAKAATVEDYPVKKRKKK